MPTTDPLVLATAALVGILGVARLVRLIVHDDFPPAVWARSLWANRVTKNGPWADLATCPFCVAPYLTAGSLAWAWFSDLHWTWWVFHIWLAASYVASMVVLRDEPAE